ncbi:MAG: TetR/AcrR family transcriptional regulator [Microbacteriaceae bacterium]|nr:TetR/AcrR family transcriptional regulator [Microbacteriaceae bacterium]
MAMPRTAKGSKTQARLLQAAEDLFAECGFHEASIVKITEKAGVALGTFYNYFESKLEVFNIVVEDLNRRVRHAMSEASAKHSNRLDAERAGFVAFFKFTAEHPALYRIIRQAEFVSPEALKNHYTRIVDGYQQALESARSKGEIGDVDTQVAAWSLMGIGELIGMRWVLWEDSGEVPEHILDEMMKFIRRAMAPTTGNSSE